jgi:hypothetical protein
MSVRTLVGGDPVGGDPVDPGDPGDRRIYRQIVRPSTFTHVLPLWLGAGLGDELGWLVTGDGVGCDEEPGAGVVLWPDAGVVL